MAGRLGFNLRYLRYYLPQTVVEANWSGGICRDLPRSSIPQGYLYDCVDWMLDRPGMAYKRGGFGKFDNVAGATATAGSFISAPTLNGTAYVFFKPADGNLYKYTSTSSAATSLGACGVTPIDFPKVYPGASDILIIPASDGTTAPKKVYIGSPTIGDLGGSPPAGKYLAIHQNRAVLGGTAANPNRIYFGPAPNVESTWDTTNSFIDTTYPITSLVSVQGVLLVFSKGFCERIIGDIPPGLDGDNMTLQPLGATGCSSPLSIQPWGNYVVFANAKGVYITNGAGFDSLTDKTNGTGIQSYWTGLSNIGTSTLVSAIYGQKFYLVYTQAASLICYLPTKSWWRLSNFSPIFTASNPDFTGSEEVFFHGNYSTRGRNVMTLSSMFNPGTGNTSDFSNAVSFLPTLTTRMIGDGTGLKAYEHGHMTHMTTSANSTDAFLTLKWAKGLKSEGFDESVAESPFVSTTTDAGGADLTMRKRFIVNFDALSMQMKVALTAAVTKSEIYALEVEVRDATYGTTSEYNTDNLT